MTTQEIVNNTYLELGSFWSGKLSASKQRELFGCYLGKGTIQVNLDAGRIEHIVSKCFGQDYDATAAIVIHKSGLSHETWGTKQ